MMTHRWTRILFGMVLVAAALVLLRGISLAQSSSTVSAAADREQIAKAAQAFADAFNKRDAKAVAALWTEQGEHREADGETFRGRAAIEKAYSEFFKSNANSRIEVLVKSIRFPAKDVAVEEGLIRQTSGPKSLPQSTSYVAIHVRESGQWKIALSAESGLAQERLEDLEWLLGAWVGKTKEGELRLSFARDAKRPALIATVRKSETGKEPMSTTVHIALDPETGRVRSWCFEDNGAHSQALWRHDGKAWLLESRGVLADGTPTSETIVIHRVGPTSITWRSIDRFVADQALPDTKPMLLNHNK